MIHAEELHIIPILVTLFMIQCPIYSLCCINLHSVKTKKNMPFNYILMEMLLQ